MVVTAFGHTCNCFISRSDVLNLIRPTVYSRILRNSLYWIIPLSLWPVSLQVFSFLMNILIWWKPVVLYCLFTHLQFWMTKSFHLSIWFTFATYIIFLMYCILRCNNHLWFILIISYRYVVWIAYVAATRRRAAGIGDWFIRGLNLSAVFIDSVI